MTFFVHLGKTNRECTVSFIHPYMHQSKLHPRDNEDSPGRRYLSIRLEGGIIRFSGKLLGEHLFSGGDFERKGSGSLSRVERGGGGTTETMAGGRRGPCWRTWGRHSRRGPLLHSHPPSLQLHALRHFFLLLLLHLLLYHSLLFTSCCCCCFLYAHFHNSSPFVSLEWARVQRGAVALVG